MKVLIMGLPGSGKTYLATLLVEHLRVRSKTVEWLNADTIRTAYNDWDFSYEGRIRQATRLGLFAEISTADIIICDFVAPLNEMRDIFEADFTIWMDTNQQCEYEDTAKLFAPPTNYDVKITEMVTANSDQLNVIIDRIIR
jgi:adenylylsulfate kinase